jgi:hypothetical protein
MRKQGALQAVRSMRAREVLPAMLLHRVCLKAR